jgi:hypothetical protein
MVGDLCNFIMDQIVYHKGTYHHLLSDLGSNPLYQHLRETDRLALGHWWQCGLVVWFGSDFGTVWTLFCMWTYGFLNGLCYNDGLHNGLCCNDGFLWIMTCDDVLNNGLVFMDVYMYICGGQIQIWIIYIWSDLNLNYFFCLKIHCRSGSWLNRPYKYTQQGQLVIQPSLQKSTTGAADITSRPYRDTTGAAKNTNRPYRVHCRGGWKHQPPLQSALQGRSENRPYRGTLCRNTLGRAAGVAAPTEALEPPLQLNFVVVC